MSEPQPPIELLADGTLVAHLPEAVASSKEVEAMGLHQLRDRLNSLEIQGYVNCVRELFYEHPALGSIKIENSDDASDNGRHVRFEIQEFDEECDDQAYGAMELATEETADYVNGAYRCRSIYDFLDEFIDLGELTRENFDEQVGQAYDEVFTQGDWARLRASSVATQLEYETPKSLAPSARSRM